MRAFNFMLCIFFEVTSKKLINMAVNINRWLNILELETAFVRNLNNDSVFNC